MVEGVVYPRKIIKWCNIHFMASYSYGIAMQTNLLDNGPFALDVTLLPDILPRITFWVGGKHEWQSMEVSYVFVHTSGP